MNVFLREMKSHRWGLLFWCIGIFWMVAAGMMKYSAFEASGQSVSDMLQQLPEGLRAVFGLSGFDVTTAAGFYGMLYLYLVVMGGIHAALIGASVISKEERDRTSEFLYTKPSTRGRILTAKLAAGLVNIIVVNLATLTSSFYYVDMYNKDEPFGAKIMLLMVGMFFIQAIFLSIGAFLAGTTHKPKTAPSRASSIMFLAFMLSVIVNLNEDLDILKYLTPFKYFEAAPLMSNGGLEIGYVALSVAIIVIAIAATYRFYS